MYDLEQQMRKFNLEFLYELQLNVQAHHVASNIIKEFNHDLCTTYIHFNADAANIEIRADYDNRKLAYNVYVRRGLNFE